MTELLFQLETEQTLWEFFEYGSKFGYDQRLFRLKRDPLIAMLAREIPSEALVKGGKLKRKDKQEIVKDSDEETRINNALEIIMRQNDQIIDAVSYDRALTHGLLTFTNPSTEGTTKDVFIKSYKPESYHYGYDRVTGKYVDSRVDVNFVERIEGGNAIKPKNDDGSTTPFTAKDSIHVATDQTDDIGVFEGYIDKIFDDAWGYYITSESATLYIARVGPGVKVYNVNEKDLNTKAKRKAKTKEYKEMSGKGTTIVNLLDMNPNSKDSSFELLTADSANFDMAVNVFRERVSMVTNIPQSRFKGLNQGELAAGEINKGEYFSVLEVIQNKYEFVYTRSMEIVSENIGAPVDMSLYEWDWNVRQTLTEKEKAELKQIQINNFVNLSSVAEKEGIDNEALQKITGIEYDQDKAMIKEFKANARLIQESMKGGNNSDNEDNLEEEDEKE